MLQHGKASHGSAAASVTNNANATWDPVAQIYTGGTVPGCDDAELFATLDPFYVFGYGSLCWNPSGTLQTVVCRGRAPDHVRVWAQKSTDHRGRPGCPGIVCTLLTRQEYEGVVGQRSRQKLDSSNEENGTQAASSRQGVTGLIYTVPQDRIQECLQELDFREKGVRMGVPSSAFGRPHIHGTGLTIHLLLLTYSRATLGKSYQLYEKIQAKQFRACCTAVLSTIQRFGHEPLVMCRLRPVSLL